MTDPFSLTVGVLGLADIGCRLCKEIFSFICAIRDASAELRRLHRTVSQLNELLLLIRDLARSHQSPGGQQQPGQRSLDSINAILEACTEDLQLLQSALGLRTAGSDTFVNRFGKRVKSVFNEKFFEKLSSRLERHKASFIALLVIMGRYA